MKRAHTVLAIVALTAAVVAWQTRQPDTRLDTGGVAPPSAPLPAESPQVAAASPALAGSPGTTPPAYRVETEEVLGLRVRKDRDCTVELRYIPDADTGEIIEAHACVADDPQIPDPYEAWDDQTLAGMAYGDPHAAEVLGLRHIGSEDPREEALGLSLLYRSVALSGDLETFQRAIGRRYAYLEVNGVPEKHNLRQLLVFSHIGEVLGDERFDAAEVVRQLNQADVPPGEIDKLREAADLILEHMAALQTEMTGDATIREAIDNA